MTTLDTVLLAIGSGSQLVLAGFGLYVGARAFKLVGRRKSEALEATVAATSQALEAGPEAAPTPVPQVPMTAELQAKQDAEERLYAEQLQHVVEHSADAQLAFERTHPVPYHPEQRVIATHQRAERYAAAHGFRLPCADEEHRLHECHCSLCPRLEAELS